MSVPGIFSVTAPEAAWAVPPPAMAAAGAAVVAAEAVAARPLAASPEMAMADATIVAIRPYRRT